jgi:hypothetical protein
LEEELDGFGLGMLSATVVAVGVSDTAGDFGDSSIWLPSVQEIVQRKAVTITPLELSIFYSPKWPLALIGSVISAATFSRPPNASY